MTGKKRAPNKEQKATKRQAETLAVVPTLKTPKHGGGKLWMGAPANPVAGPGRPPNALRDAMRGDLDKLLPDLWKRYEAKEIDALDLANFLAKYGLGTKDETVLTEHPEWTRRMAALRSALVEIVGDETATQVILRADELARTR
jgi:hypothetical protein